MTQLVSTRNHSKALIVTGHIVKFLAAIVALVMFAAVAFPAVAQVCMVMERAEVVMPCCPTASPHEQACNGAPAGGQDELPQERLPVNTHHDVRVCCAASEAPAFDAAVLNDLTDAAPVQLASRDALALELPARPNLSYGIRPDRAAPAGDSGPGFHILYGALLN